LRFFEIAIAFISICDIVYICEVIAVNHIAELRKDAELSQTDLAKILGIAQNTLSQYETGKRTPTKRIITRLADFFHVTENYILGYPEPQKNAKFSAGIKEFCISDVTVIHRYISIEDVNFYLKLGWRLLHVGVSANFYEGGEGYSTIEYTLGWFGDPADTIQGELPDDGDERYGSSGWEE
jgi:transcriptional regulator with XRE-family HTH domain